MRALFHLGVAAVGVVCLSIAGCERETEKQPTPTGRGERLQAAEPEVRTPAAIDTTLTFSSGDGLQVTADLRIKHERTAPFIVLFHQAGWSRGEYQEILPRLSDMGFNCMAIDQRSGGAVNGIQNATQERATRAGKPTTYLDAYQDMMAAMKFARAHYARGKLIAWGSSYSAALVIKLASDAPALIDGVLAFAPGEYFARFGAGPDYVTRAAKKVRCPVFMTSAKREKQNWAGVFDAIPGKAKHSFVPETAGNHGSRALWKKFNDSGAYWQAVQQFLAQYFLREAKGARE
ncbi:MAG: alpha/beta hydrolase [bacterium]